MQLAFLSVLEDTRLEAGGAPLGWAQVSVSEVWGLASACEKAARLTQFCFGERLAMLAFEGDWVRVQSVADGYCAWVHRDGLVEISMQDKAATHRTHFIVPVLAEPDLKAPYLTMLPADARVSLGERVGEYYQLAGAAQLGWVDYRHLFPLDRHEEVVSVARACLGRAYVWGGRGLAGLDCSGLSQWCYRLAGREIPRDADLQCAFLAVAHQEVAIEQVQAGDLLFLQGHVMVMAEAGCVIHASGFHMQVVEEPLAVAVARYQRLLGEKFWLRAFRWRE